MTALNFDEYNYDGIADLFFTPMCLYITILMYLKSIIISFTVNFSNIAIITIIADKPYQMFIFS